VCSPNVLFGKRRCWTLFYEINNDFSILIAERNVNSKHSLPFNYTYCTISNNSAKGGDRGQGGRYLEAGQVDRGQGT